MNRSQLTDGELTEPRSLDDLIARGLFEVVDEDYRRVEAKLVGLVQSQHSIAPEVVQHLIDAGGKRIRPVVHCLAAGASGYKGEDHILIAAVSEMIHSATLFHDDVIDEGAVRRGRPAAHKIWGNQNVVLVGDFVFARAFTVMMEHGLYEIALHLGRTVEDLVQGELLQLEQQGSAALSEDQYLTIVRYKTASLFSWCTRSGAMIAGHAEDQVEDLARFGYHFGTAFQITDDVLDYAGASLAMGKGNLNDLMEGKTTLPLILAMKKDAAMRDRYESLLGTVGEAREESARRLGALVVGSDAIRDSLAVALDHVERALAILEKLPESPHRLALWNLCKFTTNRIH